MGTIVSTAAVAAAPATEGATHIFMAGRWLATNVDLICRRHHFFSVAEPHKEAASGGHLDHRRSITAVLRCMIVGTL